MDLIQRNLSTGIGKALHAKHLLDYSNTFTSIEDQRPGVSEIPVMRHEPLPGMLGIDVTYLRWYHRHVKGQMLCAEILGVQIDADSHIEPKQEKILWDYYNANLRYKGFDQNPLQQFATLRKKIQNAKEKNLQHNCLIWAGELKNILENIDIKQNPEIRKQSVKLKSMLNIEEV